MTHCRLCSENTIHFIWQDYEGGNWFHCESCGSHSSSHSYADTQKYYTAEYITQHHGGISLEEERNQLTTNINWFEDYKPDIHGRDFLDIGCCRGVAMTMMAERGWAVHGFDVIPEAAQPGCSTIAPSFRAGLFPQKYHAVMCREVIEHVDHPMQMLTEIAAVIHKGGYLQLQTPRPAATMNPIGYQGAHITLMSPLWIRYWLERLGFEVRDYRLWSNPGGQCWMAKRL